jgi:Short repeat of unknown function (DUF308)
MSMNQPDIEQIQRAVATSLHEHWVLFLVEGIILIILGLAAVVIPPIATLAVEILYGWLFLISGIVGLITTFRMRQAPGFWWSLVSAILGIGVGIVLLLWPLSGVLLAYLDSHRVFRGRRHCLDHVRARAQARAVGTMGLDAGERHHRPDLGHFHSRRPAGHRRLGYRAAGRHQYGVRRLGADRDGAACPRNRSAFGCPGALSEAALIGKNLIQETPCVGGASLSGRDARTIPTAEGPRRVSKRYAP